MSVEIEVRREDGPAASLTLSFGTWLWARVWGDVAGAAKIGGLAGMSVRAGGHLLGVELLGAARLRERFVKAHGRLVRRFHENLRRLDVLEKVEQELLRTCGNSPLDARQRFVSCIAANLAPWAGITIEAERVVIKVPRWLPEASIRELERRLNAGARGVAVLVRR